MTVMTPVFIGRWAILFRVLGDPKFRWLRFRVGLSQKIEARGVKSYTSLLF